MSKESTANQGRGGAVSQSPRGETESDLIADRRAKLRRLREEFEVDPFGQREGGLISLAQARGQYDAQTDEAVKVNPDNDQRPVVKVAGRVMLHRAMGKLIFMKLRDATGDLQVAVSRKSVHPQAFGLAKLADLGDIVVAKGALGTTKTGEITVWARDETPDATAEKSDASPGEISDTAFKIVTKSLAPSPEKWHGLQDPELRYRKRYVDLYANPGVMQTFTQRSQIMRHVRAFLAQPPGELGPGYVEVETPMMQRVAGGAAARPFITHHNALDIDLYLRIAPELYLKRLLVGGLSRVFEINRNFRNEGLSPRHNPEFTMLELYEAFGDYHTMRQLTERLIHTLATQVVGQSSLSFGDHSIDYTLPFRCATYHELFERHNGFSSDDHDRLVQRAVELEIDAEGKDHDILLQDVWEATVEDQLIQPTFVLDYPASLCPLTKPKRGQPELAERFELYIAGMEIANAYTELNDPDIQQANFQKQVAGLPDEEVMFRTMDDDFIEALRVGMPPAGGLGIGIDRLVMLLTNSRSIRDVILFPLMRPRSSAGDLAPESTLSSTGSRG